MTLLLWPHGTSSVLGIDLKCSESAAGRRGMAPTILERGTLSVRHPQRPALCLEADVALAQQRKRNHTRDAYRVI
jgi:hypothetical protein